MKRIGWSHKGLRSAVTLLVFAWCATAFAAPNNGRSVTLRQPDGTKIEVRAFGDEFYSWLETADGHVVIREPKTRQYTYARLSANGDEFESTGIAVGKEQAKAQKLKQQIRISSKSRKAKIDRALKALSRDAQGRLVLPEELPAPLVQPTLSEDGKATEVTPPPAKAPAKPVSGSFVSLALLASFPDFPEDVTVTRAEVDSLFNDVPYSGDGNAVSVKQYFQIHSHGKVDISHVVTDWFAAPNNQAYYDVPTPDLWTRFDELCVYRLEQLEGEGFDFTQLDANNDGKADCISLFYAGGWLVGGWAGSVTWNGFTNYGLDKVAPYQVSPMEDPQQLAVVCHELGHAACKFPDLYPYDSNAADTGPFCVMSGGNWAGGGHHPAAVCGPMKYQAGWVNAVDVTASGQTTHALEVGGTNVIRYVNPENPIEYFLFEMRGEVGYEGPFGGSAVEVCPSKGLVAYHVKEDGSNSGSSIFTADNPNCDYSKPPKVLVLEDNPQTTYVPWYDEVDLDGEDAFDNGDEVNDNTTPNFNFWTLDGRTIQSHIGIGNIDVGTSNLTFSIFNGNPPPITALPRIVEAGGNSTLSVEAAGMASYSWSKVSGPGVVVFGSPDAAVTTATFDSAYGAYVLRLTMSDGVNQIVSEVSIQVTRGLEEYLGHYKVDPRQNDWHEGWIELGGSPLKWRNMGPASWVITNTADPDVFVTVNEWPYGAGLPFHFTRENGQIMQFTYNGGTFRRCTPIAHNATVSTTLNTPVAVTLVGYDAEDESLTYAVVTDPANGSLSGTEPNLTYTPDTDYTGGDCFTFEVSDGTYTSNLGTVTIDINDVPTIDAGTNQAVAQASSTLPGLYYGAVSGNIDTTTANPETEILVDVASKTEDTIAGTTTEIYTGLIYDEDGSISFTENIDDIAVIWIDGVVVISNGSWNTRTSTGDLGLSSGWHAIEIRISNGSGGSGPDSGIGIGYDPAGGTSWETLVDPGDASFLRVAGRSASAGLDGTVSDPDGDPVMTTWSVVSGPGTVRFGNLYDVDTTATFSEPGTYVLRLTGDDGSGPLSNEVTITVSGPTSTSSGTPYSWLEAFGVTNNHELGDLNDLDGDGASTWQEYLAGTVPTNDTSVFCILSVIAGSSSNQLTWYGTTNSGVMTDFIISRSGDLLSTQWLAVGTNSRSPNGTNTWVDTGFSGTNAFYRIHIAP